MSNLNHFLKEKRNNFSNYILEIFGDSDKVKEDIDMYNYVDNATFLLYVRTNILPCAKDLDKLISEKFESYFNENDKVKINSEQRNKLKRYLNMFIDLC